MVRASFRNVKETSQNQDEANKKRKNNSCMGEHMHCHFQLFYLFKMQSYRDFSEFREMQSLSLYNNFYRDVATFIDHVSGYLEIYFLFGITCNNFILTYF